MAYVLLKAAVFRYNAHLSAATAISSEPAHYAVQEKWRRRVAAAWLKRRYDLSHGPRRHMPTAVCPRDEIEVAFDRQAKQANAGPALRSRAPHFAVSVPIVTA